MPGLTIAIVEDGKVTLAHGWGVRDITTNQPVDADTIFFTGSTGKAFTNAALATLVDEGKINWDDKVIDHMPDFRMWDPWVTREMTIRDLLVHRSGLGLGEGDLLFLPNSTLSRKETVHRIRYLKPATSFRSGYAYDNILYMAAGELIEEVSGETWEQYIHDHVFAPLGMAHSTDSDAEFQANPNHARPHSRNSGAIHGMGKQMPLDENATIAQNAAPAGGLAISANDMSRWLLTQLGHGQDPWQRQAPLLGRTVAADVDWRRYQLRSGNSRLNSRSPSRTSISTLWAGISLIIAEPRSSGTTARFLDRRRPSRFCRRRTSASSSPPTVRTARSSSAFATSCWTIISATRRANGRRSSTTSRLARLRRRRSRCRPPRRSRCDRPVTSARSLCRRLYRPMVRNDQGRQSGKGLTIDFPHSTRDGGAADALSVRHIQDEPEA